MPLIRDDRIAETSTTTGVGAMALAAAITGYRRFSAVCAVADTVYYMIEAVDANNVPTGDYETGLGTYSAANELTRTTVQKSSNANAAVNFAAGTKRVMLAMTAAAIAAIVSEATSAEMWTGTSSAKVVTPKKIYDAAAPVAVVYAATVTLDGAAGISWEIGTLTGAITLANPTSFKPGQSGLIRLTQDATGGRIVTYGANWKFQGGAAVNGVLSTTANAVDVIGYSVANSGVIYCELGKAYA